MRDYWKYSNLLFGLFSACILISCSNEPENFIRNQSNGGALGTSYSITYLSEIPQDYQQEIDSVFAVVNRSMSTYIPNSDISKINRGDTTVVIDHMFKEVLQLSKQVHSRTQGYFDPTVGVLVNAWGFGPGKEIELDSLKVDSLLNFVGLDKVVLSSKGTVRKVYPEIQLDFNAIAKGYAIDRLDEMLRLKGTENYLVEVGGELVARGINKIKNKAWTVGIDDPQVETGRKLKKILSLQDKALASSGNYRKFRIDSMTGIKYVHTIDPITGFTKNSNVLSASVIANTCALADAYATAFMAMPLDTSIDFLSGQSELEAYIIYINEEGITAEYMTEGFKKLTPH